MLRKNIVIFLSLALTHLLNAQITTNGLVLNLDASDPSSYSGREVHGMIQVEIIRTLILIPLHTIMMDILYLTVMTE